MGWEIEIPDYILWFQRWWTWVTHIGPHRRNCCLLHSVNLSTANQQVWEVLLEIWVLLRKAIYMTYRKKRKINKEKKNWFSWIKTLPYCYKILVSHACSTWHTNFVWRHAISNEALVVTSPATLPPSDNHFPTAPLTSHLSKVTHLIYYNSCWIICDLIKS